MRCIAPSVREMLDTVAAPKLKSAVKLEGRVKLGSLLAGIGRKAGLSDDEFAVFEPVRDKTPARTVNFE